MLFNFCLGLSLIALTAATDFCDEVDPADDPKNIERPCKPCNMKCIQEYFAQHSDCKISNEKVDSMYFKSQRIQFSNSNMTLEVKDIRLTNIFGKIIEFYINRKTDKTVLSMEVPNLKFYSPKTTIKYNRRCKEQIVKSDYIKCYYDGVVTFTNVFPRTCQLNLTEADTFTYVDDPKIRYELGPKIYSSKDPVASGELNFALACIPLDLQEVFVYLGPGLMQEWIQRKICRFPTGRKHSLIHF